MDVKYLVSVIFGLCCLLNTVSAYLRCVECTHISWDQSQQFEGSQQVYDILRGRVNYACTMQYPLDRRAFENQMTLNAQNQNQNSNNQMFIPTNNYQVSETICPSLSNSNRCNYIFGDVDVYLANYDVTLRLNMHVRNCMNTPELENKCYVRDTSPTGAYQDIKNFMQDRLSFLSRDLTVTRFLGNQCVCNRDLCSAEVSSAVIRIQGFSFVFVLMILSYYFSKFY